MTFTHIVLVFGAPKYRKKMHLVNVNRIMDETQKQIVTGTVLGGSSLYKQSKGRNYFLSMRSKDPVWLWYKIAILQSYFTSDKLTQQNVTYRCCSICHEDFTDLYHLLYKDDKRHLTEEILNKITATGLMTWWLEGGGWAGRGKKNAYLNTTMLGEEGTNLVQRYFSEYYGIKCNVNKNKNRRKVLLSVQGTLKFWKTVEDKFPNFYITRIEKALKAN